MFWFSRGRIVGLFSNCLLWLLFWYQRAKFAILLIVRHSFQLWCWISFFLTSSKFSQLLKSIQCQVIIQRSCRLNKTPPNTQNVLLGNQTYSRITFCACLWPERSNVNFWAFPNSNPYYLEHYCRLQSSQEKRLNTTICTHWGENASLRHLHSSTVKVNATAKYCYQKDGLKQYNQTSHF